jgi:hypothetical protein
MVRNLRKTLDSRHVSALAGRVAVKKKKPGSFRNQQIYKRIQTNMIFVRNIPISSLE